MIELVVIAVGVGAILRFIYKSFGNQSEWNWDWQENRPFAETNKKMLENEILSDVTLYAGDSGTPIRAHKYMLASRSHVFCGMFTGSITGYRYYYSVTIPDIEPDILNLMIKYMYTEKCDVSSKNCRALLYAADKYSVVSLVKTCSDFLQEQPDTSKFF